MTFDVGTLVRVRGREWVVLPESCKEDPQTLWLRPMGGTEDEITGVYLPLEQVEHAAFSLPDPAADLGNQRSCRMLRDAVRLGFRSGAGPFRSLARIGVEPRPYQLVPLLMALKQDPIRLLIADDVGIGKTVEACLIARELLDRGEIGSFTVLCPPHLAEQWQQALRDQFHIEAQLILSGTAARLERKYSHDRSLFEHFPFTVVSTDYIKSERRRQEFLRSCPPLVIVDEAHGCAAAQGGSQSQRRHELLRDLVDPETEAGRSRSLVLVSATPHSGKEGSFRSLVSLLDPELASLPENITGTENQENRRKLARYIVQRRRGDLQAYLEVATPFPERTTNEDAYELSGDYLALIHEVVAWCRKAVEGEASDQRGARLHWWTALGLLSALSSSPAALATSLRNRISCADSQDPEEIDFIGRRSILDLDDEEQHFDHLIPGARTGSESSAEDQALEDLAGVAEGLKGRADNKLQRAIKIARAMLDRGYQPIFFCRFISTAEYLGEELRSRLGNKNLEVGIITGKLASEERERRVEELGRSPQRVLVCTDCLSEGINLQHFFDAVIHYDLAWTPTRHEQREGRVDRFGQPSEQVQILTIYGRKNPVDVLIVKVLLAKHKAIREDLGYSIELPIDARQIEKIIRTGILLNGQNRHKEEQASLPGTEEYQQTLALEWEKALKREKNRFRLFAQDRLLEAVNTQVRQELEEVQRLLGSEQDVRRFTRETLLSQGAVLTEGEPLTVDLHESPQVIRDLARQDLFKIYFSGRPLKDAIRLSRTHPLVTGLAGQVLETALDARLDGPGKRCGVMRTNAVERRTTLLLLRLRFHLNSHGRDGRMVPLLAEDVILAGFCGSPDQAEWLEPEAAEALLQAEAEANIGADQARGHLQRILERVEGIYAHLNLLADARGAKLLEAHQRVRQTTRSQGTGIELKVHHPADILGIFVYLPTQPGGEV